MNKELKKFLFSTEETLYREFNVNQNNKKSKYNKPPNIHFPKCDTYIQAPG